MPLNNTLKKLARDTMQSWSKNVGVFHCTACHHEWEALKSKPPGNCSWCGALGKLIGNMYEERKKK